MVNTYEATSQIFITEKSKIRKDSKLRLKKRNIPKGSIAYNRRCLGFLRIRFLRPRLKIKNVVPTRSARRMIKEFPMINHSSPAKRQKCSCTQKL